MCPRRSDAVTFPCLPCVPCAVCCALRQQCRLVLEGRWGAPQNQACIVRCDPLRLHADVPTRRLWNRAVSAAQGLGMSTDASAEAATCAVAGRGAAPTASAEVADAAGEGGPALPGSGLTAGRGNVIGAASSRSTMHMPSRSQSDSVHSSEILDVFVNPPALHAQLHGGGPLARAAVRTTSGRSAVSRQTSRGSADPGSLGARSTGGRSDNLDGPVDGVLAEPDAPSQSAHSTLNTALLRGLPESCMGGAAPQGVAGEDGGRAGRDVAGGALPMGAGDLDAELEELNLIVQAVSARVGSLRRSRQQQRQQSGNM